MYKVECYVECYSIYFCIGLVRKKRQGGEGQSAGEEGQIALLEKRERGGGTCSKEVQVVSSNLHKRRLCFTTSCILRGTEEISKLHQW